MKKQNTAQRIRQAIEQDLENIKFYRGKISRAPSAKPLSFDSFLKNEKAIQAYANFENSRLNTASLLKTKGTRTPIQRIAQERAAQGVFLDKDATQLLEKIGLNPSNYQDVQVADLTSGVHFFVNEELRGIVEGMEENGEGPAGYVIEGMEGGTVNPGDAQEFFSKLNNLKGSDKTLDITLERDAITGAQVLRAVVRNTPPTGKGTGRKKK